MHTFWLKFNTVFGAEFQRAKHLHITEFDASSNLYFKGTKLFTCLVKYLDSCITRMFLSNSICSLCNKTTPLKKTKSL